MASTGPAQLVVEIWRRKSSELAAASNDAVVPVITRALETIGAVLQPNADPDHIRRLLSSLEMEQAISMQYDSGLSNDPIRELFYGLIESVRLALGELGIDRLSPPYYRTHNENGGDPSPLSDRVPKEELIDSQLIRTSCEDTNLAAEEGVNGWATKIESVPEGGEAETVDFSRISNVIFDVPIDNVTGKRKRRSRACAGPLNALFAAAVGRKKLAAKRSAAAAPVPCSKRSRREEESGVDQKASIGRVAATEMACVICEFAARTVSTYVKHLRHHHQMSPREAGIFFRCACGNESRSHAHFFDSKCPLLSSVVVVADEDTVVKREEEEGEVHAELRMGSAGSSPTATNASTTVMKCPECRKFGSYNVDSFVGHLRKVHKMTPTQAGISFHCACGNVCRSHAHFTYGKCRNVSITVVRDEEREEEEEEEE
ncbi:hypothetical protein PFISCL1PPCAC_11576, partial [Pristionchus fissidentatus]